MAVFDKIEMDVVGVPRKVIFVPTHVFPVPPLPDAALTFAGTAERYLLHSGKERENIALISRQRSA
jgi:hypothetical protein